MNEIGGLLGLCKRAGKLCCGVEAVRNAVRRGEAVLVLLAQDASDNTKKRVINLCAYYHKDLAAVELTAAALGQCVGADASAAAAVCDGGFAKSLREKLPADCFLQAPAQDD